MSARILNGNAIRDQIYAELQTEIVKLTERGIRPGLATVLVGENPASQMYVSSKIAACEQLGLYSERHTPPATMSTEELLKLVEGLNGRDEIDGILVQLPLPPQVDAKKILEAVHPDKDVDGFHPVSVGRLVAGRPGLVACTPAGVMEILRRSDVKIEGTNAVVMGRSDIVGKPMAILLMHAHATVTICHSKTRNLPEVVRRGDIVVAAMGKAGMVQKEWIAPGATVIDVGTNRITDAALADIQVLSKRGYFTLTVGDKPFFEAPLSLLLTRADTLNLYGEFRDGFYSLDHPILLPPQQIFKPSIDIENPAVLSATVPLTLTFEGVLMRPAQ